MDIKIGKNISLTKKLGSGAFGEIFLGVNQRTNLEVAVKVEKADTPCP
jgi:casein kinase 1/casein kinase 1 epsilon